MISPNLRTLFFLSILVCSITVNGQTRIKTMFYNLLNYSSSTESKNRTTHLKTVLDHVQPDLFMVCELINENASDYLFNNAVLPYNNQFNKATYTDAQSGGSLQQMVYYNTQKLILEGSKIITTNTRDINRYTFKIRTQNHDTNPIRVEVFVTHLKASTGSSNRQKRLSSINEFVNELNNIPADRHVLFAGDFNFYTSNEEGYKKLIDNGNPIQIIDPINRPCPDFPNNGVDYFDFNNYNSTYFWNNSSFSDVHTQSTRTSGNGGAGGGMDDRFDFIMMSKNFNSSSTLFYVNNSYKAIGNNGNCYNDAVNNTSCTGTYSQSLRNALFNFSDHLPVILEIETPQNVLRVQDYYASVSFSHGNLVDNNLELTVHNPIKKVYIYNQLGQQVLSKHIVDQKKLRLDVSTLSRGLYFLKTQANQAPLKFIKR